MDSTTSEVDKAAVPSDAAPRGELLRMRQVLELVPFSRTTLWRRVRDRDFPESVRLGGPKTRVKAWWRHDVEAWLDSLQDRRGS